MRDNYNANANYANQTTNDGSVAYTTEPLEEQYHPDAAANTKYDEVMMESVGSMYDSTMQPPAARFTEAELYTTPAQHSNTTRRDYDQTFR